MYVIAHNEINTNVLVEIINDARVSVCHHRSAFDLNRNKSRLAISNQINGGLIHKWERNVPCLLYTSDAADE